MSHPKKKLKRLLLFSISFYVAVSVRNQYHLKRMEEGEYEKQKDETHDDSRVQEVEVTPQWEVRFHLGDSDDSPPRLSRAPPT